MTPKKRISCFRYLDNLRKSGVTNMFGARPYVQEAEGLTKDEASQILMDWIKTFSHDKTAADRAIMKVNKS